MVLRRGRGASRIRTPTLVRDYLSGRGPFANASPDVLAERLSQGDYGARIHQHVKQYIKQMDWKYQWPRRHSFGALLDKLLTLGLLVKTGRQEEPQERGAGQLGSARGFSLRTYVRLAPGAETRAEWADPIRYIALLAPHTKLGQIYLARLAPAVAPPVTEAVVRPRRRVTGH